ncbi:Protein CbbY [Tetrabaena socialis]|uniref:Protein CbbY n=1 Tax=Tetrabaena socialis TaxID=47790 RepID=A0A2J8A979_9CHLO|nr:Protein CbbY [Tetrabaena socialis]|eukprot:PNH09094.1 Protein CbbY [Tetrabaena socialis]
MRLFRCARELTLNCVDARRAAGGRRSSAAKPAARGQALTTKATMKALIFDCDGVILESEDLHRRAYNATFQHFGVHCGESPVDWSESFYDKLQNTVGGGKPKMRWYFGRHGWPSSSVLGGRAPADEAEQAALVDALQDWKSDKYQKMIGSGEVEPRPGVLRLMDEARAAGLKLAVCSAATKSSVVFTLTSLLGEGRFQGLDCFLAGDDVGSKKPDPLIYREAAKRLGVSPDECVVVEDSLIGLQAASGAGMRCIITYTPSTRSQAFPGAERIISDLGGFPPNVTVAELQQRRIVQDDRVDFASDFQNADILFG